MVFGSGVYFYLFFLPTVDGRLVVGKLQCAILSGARVACCILQEKVGVRFLNPQLLKCMRCMDMYACKSEVGRHVRFGGRGRAWVGV